MLVLYSLWDLTILEGWILSKETRAFPHIRSSTVLIKAL